MEETVSSDEDDAAKFKRMPWGRRRRHRRRRRRQRRGRRQRRRPQRRRRQRRRRRRRFGIRVRFRGRRLIRKFCKYGKYFIKGVGK